MTELKDVIKSLEDLLKSMHHHREALSEAQFQENVFLLLHVMLTELQDIRNGH